MNIVIVSGSPRKNSITHRLALFLKNYLQNVSAEFAQKLSVLIVDLDLVRWRTLCHNKITGDAIHGHSENYFHFSLFIKVYNVYYRFG